MPFNFLRNFDDSMKLVRGSEKMPCCRGLDRVSSPVFGGHAAVPRGQAQESLAHDNFSFAQFGIMWGFFSGWRPLAADSVCVRTFLYSCPALKPAQMQDSCAQTN
jgi:hypothetical protein